MDDYKILFATLLHAKLKENIVGSIYVKVNQWDELYIAITSYGDVRFETKIGDFSEKLLNGYSTDYAVYEVKKKFESYLRKRYFK